MKPNPDSETEISEGRLLIPLIASFYVFFTLVPDSNTLMVSWPWVAFWQMGLLCPIIWLLWMLGLQGKIRRLGNGLDWVVGLGVFGLIISSLFAPFPNQARWYAWAALGFIAALYALNHWIISSDRRYGLLVKQGYLNLAFIGVSLLLWTFQTLIPELNRLNGFRQYGVNLTFDFSVLELRNWAPIGHQNYVAGYLILALPLLVGLSILETGKKRVLWLTGVGLGLLDLYTTSSRGGWLGLVGLCLFGLGVLLLKSRLPRLWLGLGGLSTLIIILLLGLANNRLKGIITSVLQGQGGGEFAYRFINAVIGWQMGSSHPVTGIGLGGVPILYQKYRPIWAGRESELAYQLHSTPVQLWAELGIWGILSVLGGIIILGYCLVRYPLPESKTDQVFLWCLMGGLWGYGLMSITDYQLDNICISGALVIYLACLASIFKLTQPQKTENKLMLPAYLSQLNRILLYGGLGVVLVVCLWLIPIHRAWLLSSNGFMFLTDKNFDINKRVDLFVELLTKAEKLAPWEPYYPYQLGWNLGNMALDTQNPQQLQAGIAGFKRGNSISPYQEFGHSNLGWLLLQNNPANATQSFSRAAQLIPAKHGAFFHLGLSLLERGKMDVAVEAFTLEALRDPLFITSPRWRSQKLQPIYQQVLDLMESRYNKLLQKYQQPGELNSYLHSCRGGLLWWRGKLKEARQDLDNYGSIFSKVLLELSEGKSFQSIMSKLPPSPTSLVIQDWFEPAQRSDLLQKAWIEQKKMALPETIKPYLLASMEQSSNFDQWLKEKAPVWSYRRERAGFGVLSRHIDGPLPLDFSPVMENLVITTWFVDVFPSPEYLPPLDLALQPWRESLLGKVSGK